MKGMTLALITIYTIAATLFASPMTAQAAVLTFEATLIGANEFPPTGSPGTGQATVVVDTIANTLSVNVTFSGLVATGTGTTASHIHCCLSSPFQTGVNVMVATTTPTFPNFPMGVTSGTYNNGGVAFGLLDAATYNPLFVSNMTLNPGGTVASAAAVLVAALLNGETYLNIHTSTFPGGEIRGFLAPVPLPAALPLFATGLGALGLLGWRRKRKAVAA